MKSKLILLSALTILGASAVSAEPSGKGGPKGDRPAPSPEKMLERFAANADGVIDLEEIEVVFTERKEKRDEHMKGRPEGKKQGGKKRGGPKDPAKFSEIIIEKFDVDGDGSLNQEELQEFFSEANQKKGKGPRKPKASQE